MRGSSGNGRRPLRFMMGPSCARLLLLLILIAAAAADGLSSSLLVGVAPPPSSLVVVAPPIFVPAPLLYCWLIDDSCVYTWGAMG